MQEYNSNLKFIYEKPKKYNFIIIIYLILIFYFLIYCLVMKTYSKLEVKATWNNKNIIIPMILDNVNKIEKSDFLKIDGKKYNFKIEEYGEIYNNGEINLQDLKISSKINKKLENQVIEITFYYDKELLLKKIVKGVLE